MRGLKTVSKTGGATLVAKFLLLFLQKHHSPIRLAVKWCGRVDDGVMDKVLDARIGNADGRIGGYAENTCSLEVGH